MHMFRSRTHFSSLRPTRQCRLPYHVVITNGNVWKRNRRWSINTNYSFNGIVKVLYRHFLHLIGETGVADE